MKSNLILRKLRTEQPNPLSAGLDYKSSLEIARIMNAEDAKVAAAVKRALPQIARAIDWIEDALHSGGRPAGGSQPLTPPSPRLPSIPTRELFNS